MKQIAIVLITMILYTVIMDTVFVICVDECNDHRHAHISLNHELSQSSSVNETEGTELKSGSLLHCVDYSLISDAVAPHSVNSIFHLLSLVTLIFIIFDFFSLVVAYNFPQRTSPPQLFRGIRTTIIQV